MEKLFVGLFIFGSVSSFASNICDIQLIENIKKENQETYRTVALIKYSGYQDGYLDGYFANGELDGYLDGADLKSMPLGWLDGYIAGLDIQLEINKFKKENNLIQAIQNYCN